MRAKPLRFAEAVRKPGVGRASQLSSTGYYAHAEDRLRPRRRMTGRPFFYFAYGAAAAPRWWSTR
jgi:xanthine dehydrogenase molybdopterin-binding subunit B